MDGGCGRKWIVVSGKRRGSFAMLRMIPEKGSGWHGNSEAERMDKKTEISHWATESTMEYHRKQFLEPKRSTVAFGKFLAAQTPIRGKILDLACGGGAVSAYFAGLYPDSEYTGIDLLDSAFGMLDAFAPEEIRKRVTLETGDLYRLGEKYRNRFDGVIFTQTLSWLENWRTPMEQIVNLNPKWIGLSSLFYEGRIEYQIRVLDYERNDEAGDHAEGFSGGARVYGVPGGTF